MLDHESSYHRCMQEFDRASSQGRSDEALSWLNQALRYNPQSPEARNHRGELLWDNGNFDEALREFNIAIEADPEHYCAHLNRLEILIEEFGEYDETLELADELLADGLENRIEGEIFYLKAKALFYLDDLDGALFLLRRAIRTQGEAAVYRGFEGQILLELGRLEEARQNLQRAAQLESDSAHTLYHLALIAEHDRDYAAAEDLFAQAASAQPELYPRPVRMDPGEFEKTAQDAVQSLPERIRHYVRNCPIVIEELPDRSIYEGQGVSPQLLGLFVGTPVNEDGMSAVLGQAPRIGVDRIVLFKRNLEKVATNREELIEQVQVTVKHEIGHYLGLDEAELERLGLG